MLSGREHKIQSSTAFITVPVLKKDFLYKNESKLVLEVGRHFTHVAGTRGVTRPFFYLVKKTERMK